MSLRTVLFILITGALGTASAARTFTLAPGLTTDVPAPVVNTYAGEPGTQLRVWLVTAGPGDAVWERYGHNAIRLLDTATGQDIAYNWGIFDFQQVDFIPRFLQGRMLYMMTPFPTQAMMESYARANREVVLQELDLSPTQKITLRTLADRNALPENREYTYQYFVDNCSTRVRDLLDQVLGGALRRHFANDPSGTSYRDHTRRLTQVDPLIYTGMDLLLGAPTDRPITIWDEMFLPMTLRDEIRGVTIPNPDGSSHRLVIAEEIVIESARAAEPSRPPGWFAVYLLIGVALGGIIASSTVDRVRSTTALRLGVILTSTAWSTACGVAGSILLLLLITDHTFAYWNENLFLFNPLMLPLAILIPLANRGGQWRTWACAVSRAAAGIAVIGLVWQLAPTSTHHNATFFALALPAHIGLAYAFRGTTKDEMKA